MQYVYTDTVLQYYGGNISGNTEVGRSTRTVLYVYVYVYVYCTCTFEGTKVLSYFRTKVLSYFRTKISCKNNFNNTVHDYTYVYVYSCTRVRVQYVYFRRILWALVVYRVQLYVHVYVKVPSTYYYLHKATRTSGSTTL